jgi:hypothetical protein
LPLPLLPTLTLVLPMSMTAPLLVLPPLLLRR